MKKVRVLLLLLVAVLGIGMLTSCTNMGSLTGTVSNSACELQVGKIIKPYPSLDLAFSYASQYVRAGKDVTIKLNKNYVAPSSVCLPKYSMSGTVTFDLNGFTLSRKLSDCQSGGEVLNISNAGNIIIADSPGTGSIGGGKNTTSGGGIYCEIGEKVNLTLHNITVRGNESSVDGGGIYIKRTDAGNNTVKLSGKIKVSGNTKGDLLLATSTGAKQILDVSDLSSDSEISIDIEGRDFIPFVDDESEETIDAVLPCFTAESSDYKIEKCENYSLRMRLASDKGANILCEGKEYHYDVAAQAWKDANDSSKFLNKTVEVILNEDWISDGEKNLSYGIESPKYGFGNGRLWPAERPSGCTLTLNLGGYKIDRKMGAEDRKYGNILSVEKTVDLIVKNGTITGGHNDKDGGAIYINAPNAYLTLDGVTITGNKSDNNGGAIHCTGNANHLTIKDSTITENESNDAGGGIYMYFNDRTERGILFTGVVVIKNNKWKHAGELIDSDIYLDNDNPFSDASILFPTLKEGSYITIHSEMPSARLTKPAEDNEANRASLSYFHSTPGASHYVYTNTIENNNTISLGLAINRD